MAQTITYSSPYQAVRVTLDASTPTNATQVSIDGRYRRALLHFWDSAEANEAGEVSHTGTDGEAMGTEAYPVASGSDHVIIFGKSKADHVIYLRGTTAGGFCQMWLESEID